MKRTTYLAAVVVAVGIGTPALAVPPEEGWYLTVSVWPGVPGPNGTVFEKSVAYLYVWDDGSGHGAFYRLDEDGEFSQGFWEMTQDTGPASCLWHAADVTGLYITGSYVVSPPLDTGCVPKLLFGFGIDPDGGTMILYGSKLTQSAAG